MADILHRVGIKDASPAQVYDAITTVDGLAGWWTDDTKGSSDVGGVLEFRFLPGGFDMEVVELRPAERVTWRVVDGPEEWIGTTIDWTLRENIRAQLRVLVKLILRKHGYPPDKQEKATLTVLEQAEALSEGWAAA